MAKFQTGHAIEKTKEGYSGEFIPVNQLEQYLNIFKLPRYLRPHLVITKLHMGAVCGITTRRDLYRLTGNCYSIM